MTVIGMDDVTVRTRLLECSVSEDFIKSLDNPEARDLLFHVLALINKHRDSLRKED